MSRLRLHFLFWSAVSLAIHLLYFAGLSFVPDEWLQVKKEKTEAPISIEIVSSNKPSKKDDQQFVRQTDTDESLLTDNKEKARFKSEKDQRVLLETRAANVGLSKNRTQEPRFLKQAREEKERKMTPHQLQQRKIKLSQTGMDYSHFKTLDTKKEIADLGPSTVGESLPKDVSIGSFTALNTDRFTYYTFYARIEELVRFRWETKVKEAIDSFNQHFLHTQVMQKTWATEVEFLLTPNGEFYKALMIKESGISKFDTAPVWAFRDARLFPNPPQDMVQKDGFIHLNYTFNVQLNPNAFAEK